MHDQRFDLLGQLIKVKILHHPDNAEVVFTSFELSAQGIIPAQFTRRRLVNDHCPGSVSGKLLGKIAAFNNLHSQGIDEIKIHIAPAHHDALLPVGACHRYGPLAAAGAAQPGGCSNTHHARILQ